MRTEVQLGYLLEHQTGCGVVGLIKTDFMKITYNYQEPVQNMPNGGLWYENKVSKLRQQYKY